MEDSRIVELFFSRSEDAISALSDKYGKACMSVAMNVLDNEEDAKECLNSSYLSVWNSIPPNKPSSLLSYVCKIVRNISVSRFRENNAEKRKSNYALCLDEMNSFVASASTVEDEIDKNALSSYLNDFLGTLGKTNRIIFVRRFWYMDSYDVISDKVGISEGAVRTRLSRIKSDLKKYLSKKGVFI